MWSMRPTPTKKFDNFQANNQFMIMHVHFFMSKCICLLPKCARSAGFTIKQVTFGFNGLTGVVVGVLYPDIVSTSPTLSPGLSSLKTTHNFEVLRALFTIYTIQEWNNSYSKIKRTTKTYGKIFYHKICRACCKKVCW